MSPRSPVFAVMLMLSTGLSLPGQCAAAGGDAPGGRSTGAQPAAVAADRGVDTALLDRLIDTPLASALSASPDGRQVAWVSMQRGVRNVMLARAPEWQARALTTFTHDDGQELGDLGWSSDGRVLYMARGGKTGIAAVSNPEALPIPPKRELWRLDPAAGQARRIAEGHSPEVSPGGADVAYLHDGKLCLWLARTSRSDCIVEQQGELSALRWSPDGQAIAFVSGRSEHSFVGVYWLADKRLVYLDPGVDRDRAPAWSPDGSQLAFLRWAYHELLDLPARVGVPFSLRVADPRTGVGHEAWRAPAGRAAGLSPKLFWGSQFFEGDVLFWGAGDRLVFPWEGDGWLHLYSVAASGGQATLLTPGDYEVSTVRLSRDRREVVFAANRDDPDRQHLWRVPVSGGAVMAITQGRGIESSPVPLGQGADAVAYLASDAQQQVHPVVRGADGRLQPLARPSSPAPTAPSPGAALIEPQAVTLTAADGQRFQGQLLLPPAHVAVPAGGRPALLFLHGGPPDRMMLGFHYWTYYSHTQAFNQAMAQQGYVVLSINYRRGSGYGLDFREALEGGLNGASEFADVLAAGKWLAARNDVDATRVGLWGGSYGGYLTAMGLARAPKVFAAGVDLHGVHDWSTREYDEFTGGHDADGVAAEATRRAFASSPLADVSGWRAPVLFVHGDDDLNVRFDQSVRLVDALRKRGLSPEVLVFPNEPHQFLLHRSWRRALHAAMAFFERRLGVPVTVEASTDAAAGVTSTRTTAATSAVSRATPSSLPVRQDSQ